MVWRSSQLLRVCLLFWSYNVLVYADTRWRDPQDDKLSVETTVVNGSDFDAVDISMEFRTCTAMGPFQIQSTKSSYRDVLNITIDENGVLVLNWKVSGQQDKVELGSGLNNNEWYKVFFLINATLARAYLERENTVVDSQQFPSAQLSKFAVTNGYRVHFASYRYSCYKNFDIDASRNGTKAIGLADIKSEKFPNCSSRFPLDFNCSEVPTQETTVTATVMTTVSTSTASCYGVPLGNLLLGFISLFLFVWKELI